MRLCGIVIVCLILAGAPATAQPGVVFEVASLRVSDPNAIGFAMNGGPGTAEPARVRYVNVPLRRIVQKAYGVMPYQLIAPSWMTSAKYDMTAIIPQGTSVEQFPGYAPESAEGASGFVSPP